MPLWVLVETMLFILYKILYIYFFFCCVLCKKENENGKYWFHTTVPHWYLILVWGFWTATITDSVKGRKKDVLIPFCEWIILKRQNENNELFPLRFYINKSMKCLLFIEQSFFFKTCFIHSDLGYQFQFNMNFKMIWAKLHTVFFSMVLIVNWNKLFI